MEKVVINQIVSELLFRSGSSAAVTIEPYFPGGRLIGGKYTLNSHCITMYTEVIKQQCQQLFGSNERVYDYFKVVLAHELGHAADVYLASLSDELDDADDERGRQIALRIEENAWENGMKWIDDIEPGFINIILDQSLSAYRQVVHYESA
ncbi:hypothetical protein [Paenibacillus sp. 453mf]|uniref:hypothetical protein n=1 Tax=Paenibacillus sp. 453mf TaxID=1761874 RepID=UPI0008F382A7|nr:hypothetical protein [Paenibacillus sp. 453mf]SFS46511.1 hypothetical protein SAMN04488601_101841 [Paenibacillus sp. 453mf]